MKKCCVCGITNKKENQRTFYKFPLNDLFALEQWVQNMNLKDFIPKKEHFLCSDHFTDDCFDKSTFRTRLKKKAVPTIVPIADSHCVCCKRKQTVQTKSSFLQFPLHNPELVQKWLKTLGLENWQPKADSVVCRKHFNELTFDQEENELKLELLEESESSKLNHTSHPGYITCVRTEKLMEVAQENSVEEEYTPSGSPDLQSLDVVDHDHRYELSPKSLRRNVQVCKEKLKAKEVEVNKKNIQIYKLKEKVASLKATIQELKDNGYSPANRLNCQESVSDNDTKNVLNLVFENGVNAEQNGFLQSPLDNSTVNTIHPAQGQQEFINLILCQEMNFDPNESKSDLQNQSQEAVSQHGEKIKRRSEIKSDDCLKKPRLDDSNSNIQSNISEEFKIDDINESIFKNMNTLDLTKLLKKTITGQKVLNKYQDKTLPGKIRKVLVDLIIRSLMEIPIIQDDGKIKIPELKNQDFLVLTKKFCAIFKKESPDSYFIPPKTEGKSQTISRGKFVDKYRNLRTTLKELGFFESKISDHEDQESDEESENSSANEHIDWLLNNDAPWSSVLSHWQSSVKIRQSEFKRPSETVKVIFDKYPALKQPLGYELIESDFKHEIGKEGVLEAQWPKLSEKIHVLMKSEIKDKSAKELLETLASKNVSEGEKDLKLLMLLPALCPPTCRIRKEKAMWKPTIEEARASFILHVKTHDDIAKELEEMRQKCANFDLSLQPLIFVVGPNLSEINHFYVNIIDTRYSFKTILDALDLCFKSFHVLHTNYPKPSEPVWLFLQKSIYSLTTKWDKKFSCVATLLSAIENM